MHTAWPVYGTLRTDEKIRIHRFDMQPAPAEYAECFNVVEKAVGRAVGEYYNNNIHVVSESKGPRNMLTANLTHGDQSC